MKAKMKAKMKNNTEKINETKFIFYVFENIFYILLLGSLIFSLSVSVGAQPDLTVTNITCSPANPTTGDNVTITVTIKNSGNIDSNLDKVNVSNNFRGWMLVNLTNKTEVNVIFDWGAIVGEHNTTVIVDPTNEINETNESNNELTKQMQVNEFVYSNYLTLKWRYNLTDASFLHIVDLDSDTYKEIVIAQNDAVYVIDKNGSLRWVYSINSTISHLNVVDLNNDTNKEIIIGSQEGNISTLDKDGSLRRTFFTNSTIHSIHSRNLNNDSYNEIVIVSTYEVNSNKWAKVYIVDKILDNNATQMWIFNMSLTSNRIDKVYMPSPEGVCEIIVISGTTLCNMRCNETGAKLNCEGIDEDILGVLISDINNDSFAEIITFSGVDIRIFDKTGNKLNQSEHFSHGYVAKIVDLEDDGYKEIIAWGSMCTMRGCRGDVTVFNRFANIIWDHSDWSIQDVYVEDVGGDANKEVLVEGYPIGPHYVFDKEGILKKDIGWGCMNLYAFDLDMDGYGELIVVDRGKSISVFDREYNLKWRQGPIISHILHSSRGIQIGDLDNDGYNEIVVHFDKIIQIIDKNDGLVSEFEIEGCRSVTITDMDNNRYNEVLVKDAKGVSVFVRSDDTRPDISPVSISFNSTNPIEGDVVAINAHVRNQEPVSADNVVIEFLIDDEILHTGVVNILGHSEIIVKFNWTSIVGTHNITVITDPDNDINESYEDNNQIDSNINVRKRIIPDLIITGLQIYNSTTCGGTKVEANITTIAQENTTPNINIEFLLNNKSIENRYIYVVANSKRVITFNWVIPYGNHTITVKTDSKDEIIESNEENNIISKSVFIPSVTIPALLEGTNTILHLSGNCSKKDVDFVTGGDQIIYLEIPKNAGIRSARMSLQTNTVQIENLNLRRVNICRGNCGSWGCKYSIDTKTIQDTFSSDFGHYTQIIRDYTSQCSTDLLITKLSCLDDNQILSNSLKGNMSIDCQNIKFVGGFGGTSYTDTCAGCDKINYSLIFYIEPAVSSPSLDVGNDGTLEWNPTGVFSESQVTIDISSEMMPLTACNCPGCIDLDLNCRIPLRFHSNSSGRITISDIEIRYLPSNASVENPPTFIAHMNETIDFGEIYTAAPDVLSTRDIPIDGKYMDYNIIWVNFNFTDMMSGKGDILSHSYFLVENITYPIDNTSKNINVTLKIQGNLSNGDYFGNLTIILIYNDSYHSRQILTGIKIKVRVFGSSVMGVSVTDCRGDDILTGANVTLLSFPDLKYVDSGISEEVNVTPWWVVSDGEVAMVEFVGVEPGDYVVHVSMDGMISNFNYSPENTCHYTYENGCLYEVPLCPKRAPDLIINNIQYLPLNSITGYNVAITANIKNIGNITAENLTSINVSFYIDNNYKNSKIINLTNKLNETVNFSWIAELGVHNITIIVDPDNEVNESNCWCCCPDSESNNNLTTQILVIAPPGENIPPFIEAKWELPDDNGAAEGIHVYFENKDKVVTKCAIACDYNNISDIAEVEAYVYYPNNVLMGHEYLSISQTGSTCWQTIPSRDYIRFMMKYNSNVCNIYEGNLTLTTFYPVGKYKVMINVTDANGTYGNMSNYFEYSGVCGIDMDGDGVGEYCDNCPRVNNTQADGDGDGVGDACDNCINIINPSQINSDNDSKGDACDNDADGDNVLDKNDNCPKIHNPDQNDADGDYVGDACDNCNNISNFDQGDLDSDDLGNACDNCPAVKNLNQTDNDSDGIGDICEVPPNVWALDASGKERNTFFPNWNVYVNGQGLPSNTEVDIYIIPHKNSWTNGELLANFYKDNSGVDTVITNPDGTISKALVWSYITTPLSTYNFDIVVDADRNGKYNDELDVVTRLYVRIDPVWASDSNGTAKDVFYTNETVYVNGAGLPVDNTNITVYIFEDFNNWINSRLNGNFSDWNPVKVILDVQIDANGNFVNVITAWINHSIGDYDVIADHNNDGVVQQNEISGMDNQFVTGLEVVNVIKESAATSQDNLESNKNQGGSSGGGSSSSAPLNLPECLDDSFCGENESCVTFSCTDNKIENKITDTNLNETLNKTKNVEEIETGNEFETNKSNIEAGNKPGETQETSNEVNEKPAASDSMGIFEKYFVIFGIIILAALACMVMILKKM